LISYEVIVNFIVGIMICIGLKVIVELDEIIYFKGIKIIDCEMVDLETQYFIRYDFYGEWNYRVSLVM